MRTTSTTDCRCKNCQALLAKHDRDGLTTRRAALREGPRTLAELARVVGVRASTLHLQLTGRRPMPAEVAAAIRRALPEIQDHE